MSLCESICTYKGYVNNHIICECDIKVKFNSFLNVNVSKYDLIYRFESSKSNRFNFWVFKCYDKIFNKNLIFTNLCSDIILGILIITFISIVIFCIKEHDILNKNIFLLIKLTLKNQKNFEQLKKDIEEMNNNKNKVIRKNKKKAKKKEDEIVNTKLINISQKSKGNNGQKDKENNDLFLGSSIGIMKDKKENKITDYIEEYNAIYEEKTDNELNYFPYFDALLKDKRTLLLTYLSLIKSKQIFLIAFSCKNDFIPRTIKICFLLHIISIFLISNMLFITDSILHDLYITKGNISILSDLPKIIYATIISSLIKNILLLISFPDGDILLIRRNISERIFQKKFGIQKSISMVAMRCYLYFFISILVLSLFFVYIDSFFMVFQNTQIYALKNTLISLGISFVYPFVLYIIPAFIRNAALKDKGTQSNYCLFVISKIFQILL